jgi:hypothetical protein
MISLSVTADRQDYFGQEIFDLFVAEAQWRSNYENTPAIAYQPPQPDTVNILFLSMPDSVPDDLDLYHLVLLDNADEAFGRGTEIMYQILYQHQHSFLVCNSLLHPDHFRYSRLHSRIITTMLHWNYHRRAYIEPMFAPSREYQTPTPLRGSMIYINGRNRSWREHITCTLRSQVPRLAQHNILHNHSVSETKFVWYEDSYDTQAREYFNTQYCNHQTNSEPPEQRWPSLPMGVAGRFGQLEFYDRFFPAFRQHHVIVYPESTWQNNILSLNEKSLRCFLHQRWAMPFGGANMHALFQQQGLATAWVLLPPELAVFDQCLDHVQRWQQQCTALNWLLDHPEVFDSEFAQMTLMSNRAQCIVLSSPAGAQLYNIIYEKT